MLNLKVNDYVRTKDGIIAKCIKEEPNLFRFDRIIIEEGYYNDYIFKDIPLRDNFIWKYSSNLIDLIEVGDIVNNYPIVEIHIDPFNKGQTNLITNALDIDFWGDRSLMYIHEDEIYSIVTKEQLNKISYKVVKDECKDKV